MLKSEQRRTILMADDDVEDCLLVRDALREAGLPHELRFVHDGEDLLDYLRHEGQYAEGDTPWPDLILLDLKMSRKDGRETLQELKADPRWRRIPVVALTTSTARDDVEFCYNCGVNAYITKPVSFRGLVDIVNMLGKFWFEVVELPTKACHGRTTD